MNSGTGHEITLDGAKIYFTYKWNTLNTEINIDIDYFVTLADGMQANESPLTFKMKRTGDQWIIGTMIKDIFKPGVNILEQAISEEMMHMGPMR